MKNGWQWGHVSKSFVFGLEEDWQQRLSLYTHLYIGYSGGLDSTVLLNMVASCPELTSKVIAVHVHHGLSPHADAWSDHCQHFCQRLNVVCKVVKVAVTHGPNLEERARIVRYQAFDDCLEHKDALLLAHPQNDQSETVLLNLLRGSGLEGLCAMPEQRICGKGVLIRPLLDYPRQRLLEYAQCHELTWIEDEMNTDCEWSRVYLRLTIIPLLQKKWPNLAATIATSAKHCQEAKQGLNDWIEEDCPEIEGKTLKISEKLLTNKVYRTQLLRFWLRQQLQRSPSLACIQQITQTMISASQDARPAVRIGTWIVRRYQQTLYLVDARPQYPKNLIWTNFPQPVAWLSDLHLIAIPDEKGVLIPDYCKVELKMREGGETIHRHGQTQSLKKLFQNWSIPPWQRSIIPLVFAEGTLIAIPDYAYSDLVLSDGPGQRYTIMSFQP